MAYEERRTVGGVGALPLNFFWQTYCIFRPSTEVYRKEKEKRRNNNVKRGAFSLGLVLKNRLVITGRMYIYICTKPYCILYLSFQFVCIRCRSGVFEC